MCAKQLGPITNRYRVLAFELPVRTAPDFFADTIKTMPMGSILAERVGEIPRALGGLLFDWLRVAMSVKGRAVDGFVPRRYVQKLHSSGLLPEAHLEKALGTVRRNSLGRVYRLNEEPMPRRPVGGSDTAIFGRIIDWLDVEHSLRYREEPGKTFCNIYAHDFACLCGAYIPRVWWTADALAKLQAGESVVPDYGKTVREQRANDLFDWLTTHGSAFGWRKLADATAAQDAANAGQLVVMVGKRIDTSKPGHISVVVPETPRHKADRKDGQVVGPLQSQAGGTNYNYYNKNWGISAGKWRDRGFWSHP